MAMHETKMAGPSFAPVQVSGGHGNTREELYSSPPSQYQTGHSPEATSPRSRWRRTYVGSGRGAGAGAGSQSRRATSSPFTFSNPPGSRWRSTSTTSITSLTRRAPSATREAHQAPAPRPRILQDRLWAYHQRRRGRAAEAASTPGQTTTTTTTWREAADALQEDVAGQVDAERRWRATVGRRRRRGCLRT